MILDALIAQIQQRFDYEKRAQVCLWFDEKREFIRLLPALRARLGEDAPPRHQDHQEEKKSGGGASCLGAWVVHLLEYDPALHHGQIWIKHQIYKHLSAAPPDTRRAQRFVIYVPLSEDRLDSPDDEDRHHLELLGEYRITGLIWRIGGKRPSLFSFLRQAGVRLPDSPSEQRRLWDGGADSLLAKYVAKSIDRPEAFQDVLTPEIIQARLIGDADQKILDLAVDPDATLKELQRSGLAGEFVNAVRERYGFDYPLSDPSAWLKEFVTVLALTEVSLGYSQPADFPFKDRLPPATLRAHHVDFLRRWLRDAQSRPAWDRWIAAVEQAVDLSPWAKGHEGLSFAFPHLVKLRWQATLEEFERAAPKASDIESFYQDRGEIIRREAEFALASHVVLGDWKVFEALGRFVVSCRLARQRIAKEVSAAGLASLYVELAPQIDAQHLLIRRQASENELPSVGSVADRVYGEYATELNQRFFEFAAAEGTLRVDTVPGVTARLAETIWQRDGRRAVIIVDALRLDCAYELKGSLAGQRVEVEALYATLPTITPVGMTALLPLSNSPIHMDVVGNTVRPMLGGMDMSVRQNRLNYLTQFGADCRDIDQIEAAASAPGELGDLLLVFGHEEVDHIGHGDAMNLIRHLAVEIQRLVRLIRKLHRWGYPEVHVVTDHGFVLLEEDRLPPEVECKKAWCELLKERYALIHAAADVPIPTFPLDWSDELRIAVPPGMAFFKAEKSFSHGGATLQELIIPHLTSKTEAAAAKPVGIEVMLPTYTLMQSSVRVVLRATLDAKQMALPFGDAGRTLSLDVLRTDESGSPRSVLPAGRAKELRVNATDRKEVTTTLFFDSGTRLREGELLDLDIRDVGTGEQFPPGGIKLTVGRTM